MKSAKLCSSCCTAAYADSATATAATAAAAAAAVSKLLDLELFPAEPAKGVVQQLPHVKLLGTHSIPHHHHKISAAAAAAAAAARPADSAPDDSLVHDVITESHFEIFTEKPCWGTFKISGADIVSWSFFSDQGWTDAASFISSQQRGSGDTLVTRKKGAEGVAIDAEEDWGDGVVRSLVVKWTSEQQQGPLHWPMRVRYYSKQQQQQGVIGVGTEDQQQPEAAAEQSDSSNSSSSKPGLSVELHVGYVERTADLAAVQARVPEWSTLTYEATTYISSWQF
jgi:hypothetical protein